MSLSVHNRAQDIVDRLLESDPDDIDPEHYLSRVAVGSTDEVVTKLGFRDSMLRIPLEHTEFLTSFDQPEPRHVGYVEITQRPDRRRTWRTYSDGYNEWEDDWDTWEWRRIIAYTVPGLAIMYSRTVIASRNAPMGDRIAHVVHWLIDAIKAEDGKHTDLYDFAQAIDKRWGRQPNRIVRRKPRS